MVPASRSPSSALAETPAVPPSTLHREILRARTRLHAMSSRLDTVEQLLPIDAASAARRVRAAVAELDRIVLDVQEALAPPASPTGGAPS